MNKEIIKLAVLAEEEVKEEFNKINKICEFNSLKVLEAFRKNRVSENCFYGTTGYGYNDLGREVIEQVYADVFKCEDALVRTQFVSATHALTVALFAILRPNDTMLSITGKPYDTLDEVIGIKENNSSLKAFKVNYEETSLIDDDFNYSVIAKKLEEKFIKLVYVQRSKGYSTRKDINIEKLKEIIDFIKGISPKTIIVIDNCYCELVSTKEPTEVGADLAIGSLIKNLGGGIVPTGAYIVGKKNLVALASERLTVPHQGKEVGATLNINKQILQGLFMAPTVVASSLKTAIFTSKLFELLGYNVNPKYNDERVDIVQSITFNNEEKLIKYCETIQAFSPIDSNVRPIPWDMPGYNEKIIMAAGTFNQGSSIELSCDGPIKKPYIIYQQGSLTYEYGKFAVIYAAIAVEK